MLCNKHLQNLLDVKDTPTLGVKQYMGNLLYDVEFSLSYGEITDKQKRYQATGNPLFQSFIILFYLLFVKE